MRYLLTGGGDLILNKLVKDGKVIRDAKLVKFDKVLKFTDQAGVNGDPFFDPFWYPLIQRGMAQNLHVALNLESSANSTTETTYIAPSDWVYRIMLIRYGNVRRSDTYDVVLSTDIYIEMIHPKHMAQHRDVATESLIGEIPHEMEITASPSEALTLRFINNTSYDVIWDMQLIIMAYKTGVRDIVNLYLKYMDPLILVLYDIGIRQIDFIEERIRSYTLTKYGVRM